MQPLHGFELLRDEHIDEINSRVRLYRHLISGAELLTMNNDDENKVFGITFRTPPPDSSGVAHIMEHSVLCGSRKYPLREPFVELIKGSLNTFLNAFTYPDKTCYPVASQNLQDFYNLVDVYLDAVFYPNLTENTLRQEGWHYDIEDPAGKLTYKGVVYNEMKGAYSSPDSYLSEMVQQRTYPDTCYGINSGGDPQVIPQLTYAQFIDFHRRYYHPANARIFVYGDDPEEKRLELLDAYLKDFPRIEVDSSVGLQAPFPAPAEASLPYEVSEDEQNPKALVAVGWALAEGYRDPQLSLGLAILGHILTGTPASPLRKTLIDSGLGEDLTGAGLDGNFRQIHYQIGLKGVAAENTRQVEALILQTLRDLAKEGIERDTVLASLNTVEFRLRERNTGGFPRGLAVMLDALETWLYDGDLYQALRIDPQLAEIRRRVEAGESFFENLLERWFVQNPHRITLTLLPDGQLAQNRAAEEEARLAKIQAGLSEAEIQQAVEQTATLRRLQETPDSPEALATIPVLGLQDLEREIRRVPTRAGGAPNILIHELFTNGIVYVDLAFNLRGLPQRLLGYLPLFSRALMETGTKDLSFISLTQQIGQKTGGIRPQLFFSAKWKDAQPAAELLLRGKAMTAQSRDLFTLLADILLNSRLDNRERFTQMLLEDRASLEASLTTLGHRFVGTRARAHFTQAGWLSDLTSGIGQLFFLRELEARLQNADAWQAVSADLAEMRRLLIRSGNLLANLTVSAEDGPASESVLAEFMAKLPSGKSSAQVWVAPVLPAAEGLSLPTQVNFVGKALDLYAAGYAASGASGAVMKYLSTTWLWEKVRVQGGAYGGLGSFDPYSGILTLMSYRDPNLLKTLEIYDRTAQFLQELELSQPELEKAIIGAIGDLDAYQFPDAKGFNALVRSLIGIDDVWRQEYRDALLATTLKDFRALGNALSGMREQGRVAVLASPAALEAAAHETNDAITIRKVL